MSISGSLCIDIVSILVSLICVSVCYLRWKQGFWQRMGVYTQPPRWIFGNVRDLMFQTHNQAEEFKMIYDDYKNKGLKYGGYYAFGKPIFVPIDLDLIRSIMVKDFTHFTDHGIHSDPDTEPLTGHLFALKGQEWRSMRTKLTPTFTSGKMKMMFNILLDCSIDLTEYLDGVVEKKIPIDIKDVIAKFTTDTIMKTAFGLEGNCFKNPDTEYRKYGMKFFQSNVYDAILRFLIVLWPEFLYFFKISPIRRDISKFFQRIANETVAYREKNNIIRKDFMHLLIQLKNNVKIHDDDIGSVQGDRNDVISMKQLIGQAWIFFIAGFETSSSTATFCLYELIRNSKYQDQLREEVNDVLGRHNGEVTYEALQEMTFMEKCIQETLRLYPIQGFHPRECTKDYQIPGSDIVIPKGCMVMIPILGIQRDMEYYPDPLVFNPERFTQEEITKRHPSTWLPFGDGPRLCIGMRFAFMEIKLALTVLMKNYKFTLNEKTKLPISFDPTAVLLSVQGDIWLNAVKI